MPDSTIFSFDVATAKARNAFYFSTREGYDVLRGFVETNPYDHYRGSPSRRRARAGRSRTARSALAASRSFLRGSISRSARRGSVVRSVRLRPREPCTEGPGPSRGANRNYLNQTGIVWFPGSAPLYKGGRLVGGIGVSGDGV